MSISNNKIRKKTGFTLIELLVVVLLIGILSGVILSVVNVSGIRAKARDNNRKSDLKKVQTALELYFLDNRKYPTTGNTSFIKTSALNSYGLTTNYLSPIPSDPTYSGLTAYGGTTCSGVTFDYSYMSDGTTGSFYLIFAKMEVATSANDSPCNLLPKAGAIPGIATCTKENMCYGVQNPF